MILSLSDVLVFTGILWFNGGLLTAIPVLGTITSLVCITFGYYISTKKIIITKKSGVLGALLFSLLTIPSSIILYRSISYNLLEPIIAAVFLMVYQYIKQRSYKAKEFIFLMLILDATAIHIVTILKLQQNPNAARLIAAGRQYALDNGLKSLFMLADYGRIFSTVFIIILIFQNIDKIQQKKPIIKIVVIIYMTTGILMIFLADYAIALLTMLFGIALSIALRRQRPGGAVLIVAVFFIVLLVKWNTIISIMINSGMLGHFATTHLVEIQNYFYSKTITSDGIGSRVEYYLKTINSLPKYLLLGAFEQGDGALKELGNHTEWLDFIGTYGVFRATVWFYALFKMIRYSLGDLISKKTVLFILIVIVGMVDPIISITFLLMMLLFAPLLFDEEIFINSKAIRK